MKNRRQKSEVFPTTADITEQTRLFFENPGAGIEPIEISQDQVYEEIDALEAKLQKGVDWDEQNEAMTRCIALINGGAFRYESFKRGLNRVSFGITQAATNLRSSLVKTSCQLISLIAQNLGQDIDFVGDFIPSLSTRVSHGTQIIAESCYFAIITIAKWCPTRKTMLQIIDMAKSKNATAKKISAECLKIASLRWNIDILSRYGTQMEECLKKLLVDASPDVRQRAREAVMGVKTALPKVAEFIISNCDGRTKKILSEEPTEHCLEERIGSTEKRRRAPSVQGNWSPKKNLDTLESGRSKGYGVNSSPITHSARAPSLQPRRQKTFDYKLNKSKQDVENKSSTRSQRNSSTMRYSEHSNTSRDRVLKNSETMRAPDYSYDDRYGRRRNSTMATSEYMPDTGYEKSSRRYSTMSHNDNSLSSEYANDYRRSPDVAHSEYQNSLENDKYNSMYNRRVSESQRTDNYKPKETGEDSREIMRNQRNEYKDSSYLEDHDYIKQKKSSSVKREKNIKRNEDELQRGSLSKKYDYSQSTNSSMSDENPKESTRTTKNKNHNELPEPQYIEKPKLSSERRTSSVKTSASMKINTSKITSKIDLKAVEASQEFPNEKTGNKILEIEEPIFLETIQNDIDENRVMEYEPNMDFVASTVLKCCSSKQNSVRIQALTILKDLVVAFPSHFENNIDRLLEILVETICEGNPKCSSAAQVILTTIPTVLDVNEVLNHALKQVPNVVILALLYTLLENGATLTSVRTCHRLLNHAFKAHSLGDMKDRHTAGLIVSTVDKSNHESLVRFIKGLRESQQKLFYEFASPYCPDLEMDVDVPKYTEKGEATWLCKIEEIVKSATPEQRDLLRDSLLSEINQALCRGKEHDGVIKVLQNALSSWGCQGFQKTIVGLLTVAHSQTTKNVDATLRFVMKSLNPIDVFEAVKEFIQDSNPALSKASIDFCTRNVSKIEKSEVESVALLINPELTKAFESPAPEIRKSVVMAYVELFVILGEETMNKLVSKLSKAQRKLIAIYFERRQKK